MHFRTRRRLDVLFVTIGGLGLAAVAAVTTVIGDGERIGHYWVAAHVDGGQAQVVEVIDYDFGPSSRHGIYRDIDDLDPDAPVEVSSPTAPDGAVVTSLGLGTRRIRIGDPDRTISGRHRYRIEYPLTVAPDGTNLSWDAIGDRWVVDIESLEVHLTGTTSFEAVQCSKGRAGTWGGCTAEQVEPGHLVVTTTGLDAGEGITISATAGAPLTSPPSPVQAPSGPVDDTGTGILWPAGLALVAGLIGAAPTSRLVRRAGRELVWAGGVADAAFGPQFGESYPTRLADHAELDRLASIEFAPPKGLTAWQGGALHGESAGKDQQVAWLLERAADGDVSVSGIEVSDGEVEGQVVLHRQGRAADRDDEESLHGLFGGRTSVSLDAYDEQFAIGWKLLAKRIERWQRHAPYWDPRGDRRRNRAYVAGAGSLVLGVLALAASAFQAGHSGPGWLIGVGVGAVLAGAGCALLIRGWELRVRTPEGSGLWILVESFRRFIEQSDAQHVEAAAREGRLREYTAWATALGEADHWRDAVADADLDRSVGSVGIGHALMASHLMAATGKASTSPTSSGGGGGGVGGGAGGGGGGSW